MKPSTSTRTPLGHVLAFSLFSRAAFRPQTATICVGIPRLRPSSASACIIASSPPTPSPPPTTSAVSQPLSPNARRVTTFDFGVCQKVERMGKPYRRICRSWSPRNLAARRSSSDGTKQKSTLLSNQCGCAEPKSVTTVQKGTRLLPPPIFFNASIGSSCVSGCIDTTKSGSNFSRHARNLPTTPADFAHRVVPVRVGHRTE
mmetsp:Transcript_5346/g.13928  ORF Transcript_5346/g.13928 Transcript_5346/m.13928 type:complete len:202 (+) Transcript_5346:598-1203(+)